MQIAPVGVWLSLHVSGIFAVPLLAMLLGPWLDWADSNSPRRFFMDMPGQLSVLSLGANA